MIINAELKYPIIMDKNKNHNVKIEPNAYIELFYKKFIISL